MRKLFVYCITALLLLPSLVCAMPVCPENLPRDNGESLSVGVTKPHCVEIAASGSPERLADNRGSAAPMLFSDCTGVDLQQSAQSFQLSQPVFSPDLLDDAPTEFALGTQGHDASIHAIRGPPVGEPVACVRTAIYFITQRIRI